MAVPSFQFLAFTALAAVLLAVSSKAAWRGTVLFVFNVAFFATFASRPLQALPFVAMLAAGFLAVKALENKQRHWALTVAIVVMVGAFCWLKKYSFVPAQWDLQFAYLTVGMSYVFFRVLHLVIDAGQSALPERISLLKYVNYTLNFTCLVAGPIQLYPDYLENERNPQRLTAALAGAAIERLVLGFFKVSIMSTPLYAAHQWVVAHVVSSLPLPARIAYAAALLAIFPLYLYCNFSGYTDFVIGAAAFLRIRLPENFNKPFIATSVIDFWSRWHLTLSNWLKMYVYSPLLLSLLRRFQAPAVAPFLAVIAFFVTFFLVGVWHGQTSNFLFFGLLTGLGISVNKLYEIVLTKRLGRKSYKHLSERPAFVAFARGANFAWFCFTMLWFWSSWPQIAHFEAVIGVSAIAAAVVTVIAVTAAATSAVTIVSNHFTAERGPASALMSPYARTAWYTALAVIVASFTVLLNAPAAHIVYRAF